MTLTVLYFAWVRERIGVPREVVQTGAATVAGLVAELADFDAPLAGVREVAFFPPMTGG